MGEEQWADPAHEELTHYFKFAQLADGEIPIGETWPLIDTPRVAHLPPGVRPVDLFNAVYRLLFITMEDTYAAGSDQGGAVGHLYRLMSRCMAPIAQYLVTLPIDGEHNAGPTFEVYRFRGDPAAETLELARAVAGRHPELAPVERTLWAMPR